MGRYIGPKDKLSRREGINLFDKVKNPLQKRNYPPGVHGPNRQPRLSTYGQQLREKQKAKRMYGLLEKQFVNYYKKAFAKKGDTGEILYQLLESRLDNVIYRAGLADSRAQARQMVNHAFFLVNGKSVDIPSYQCRLGDEITLKSGKIKKNLIVDLTKKWENKTEIPEWLAVDIKKHHIKIVTLPVFAPDKQLYDVKSIIEFYSK